MRLRIESIATFLALYENIAFRVGDLQWAVCRLLLGVACLLCGLELKRHGETSAFTVAAQKRQWIVTTCQACTFRGFAPIVSNSLLQHQRTLLFVSAVYKEPALKEGPLMLSE